MPRKNNPQQTVENIIAVSKELFIEKGFDKTSMQDIVSALGMSKGAIFHHFKSKEDIFNAVINRHFENAESKAYEYIAELKGLNAKEKMIISFEKFVEYTRIQPLDRIVSSKMQNPHIIKACLDGVNNSSVIISELIREGIEDGSVATEFPDECAHVLSLLFNIWCDPAIFKCDTQTLRKRFKFIQYLTKKLGVDIVSDKFIDEYIKLMEELYKEEQ